ncbi:hypothetical protein SP6_30_02610 [Sphingomonas paucimobilis NBRC 13935]|uniref:DNA, contig: SP630 n=2 Tax=Sphingomonas paucimobilis TaxID=13689 RepID=A0A0C9M2Y5_SPHPI|nr:hypothetical protein SP6_30_02610 [Sphingomonas paucimobilis NBRC 13935]
MSGRALTMAARWDRDTLPHIPPKDRCSCEACDAKRRARWASLSPAQRRAMLAVHPTSPRHVPDVLRTGVRWSTLATLLQRQRGRPALIEQLGLKTWSLNAESMPFLRLSQAGADLLDTVQP